MASPTFAKSYWHITDGSIPKVRNAALVLRIIPRTDMSHIRELTCEFSQDAFTATGTNRDFLLTNWLRAQYDAHFVHPRVDEASNLEIISWNRRDVKLAFAFRDEVR